MQIKFNDIQQAYDFVNFGSPGDHAAFLGRKTGKSYYTSGFGDSDEIPDDIEDEEFIGIPTKKDLDLGRNLVLDFAAGHLQKNFIPSTTCFVEGARTGGSRGCSKTEACSKRGTTTNQRLRPKL